MLLSRRKHSPASICLSASYPLCKYCILKTHSLRSVFILVMNHYSLALCKSLLMHQKLLQLAGEQILFIKRCLQCCLNNYILYWADGVACIIKLFSLRLVKFQVFAIGAAVSSQANPLLTCLQWLERPKHFVWEGKCVYTSLQIHRCFVKEKINEERGTSTSEHCSSLAAFVVFFFFCVPLC